MTLRVVAFSSMPQATSSRSVKGHQAVTITLLFIAGLVNFLDRSSLSVANSRIRAEMHLSATQMGLLLSVFSVAYGLTQLPLAGLLDRAGSRWMMGGALAVWSAAQVMTGFVRSLQGFLVLRVLLGIGEGPYYPTAVRSIREWFTYRGRGRATSSLNVSSTVGLALAPPLLTAIMLQVGWRRMFILLGLAGLAIAVLWVMLHRERSETEYALPVKDRRPGLAWGLLLRQRSMWGMMIGFGGVNYTNWLYIAWLPGYLQTARHLSLQRSGWAAAIPFLAGMCGVICSGLFADFLAVRRVSGETGLIGIHRSFAVVGLTLSAGCTLVVAQATTTTVAIAGVSAALFFMQFAGTSGWGLVQAASPAALIGGVGSMQNFGSFMIASAAPFITGWLVDRTHSFTAALWLCSAVTLAGAMSYLFVVKGPIQERT